MDSGSSDGDDETLNKIAYIEQMLHKAGHRPTAADVLLNRMLHLVNQEDTEKIIEMQTIAYASLGCITLHLLVLLMVLVFSLQRFEKTNEMLVNFNHLSTVRFASTCEEFKRHTRTLTQMKTDLDSVFKRIR